MKMITFGNSWGLKSSEIWWSRSGLDKLVTSMLNPNQGCRSFTKKVSMFSKTQTSKSRSVMSLPSYTCVDFSDRFKISRALTVMKCI